MSKSVPSNPLTPVTIKSVYSLLNSMPAEHIKSMCKKVVEVSLFTENMAYFFIVFST